MTQLAQTPTSTLRRVVDALITSVFRSLWKPASIDVWPGWRFDARRSGFATLLRRAALRLRRRVDVRSSIVVRWYEGVRGALELGSDVTETVFLSGTCEPNELRFVATILDSGMTAVDVGANVGWYTLLMASRVGPSGKVVAFEPSARERSVLNGNLSLNGFAWVTVSDLALLDRPADVILHLADAAHRGQNTLGTFVYPGIREVSAIPVTAAPLDTLVEGFGLSRIDLMKIDVEGAEVRVLRGAATTLRRFAPVLLLEVQPDSLHNMGDDVASLLSFLGEAGYEVAVFADDTGLPTLDSKVALSANVVAIPREKIARLRELGAVAPP